MKHILLIAILVLGTSIAAVSQTAADRSEYVNFMNYQAQKSGGSKVKFTNSLDGDTPQIIITFNLSDSPNGKIVLEDIPYFVRAASWTTFETMFDAGFKWICFDQLDICYNKKEILQMIN